MKIPSPWPNHPHVRFNVNNGDYQGTFGVGPEMDLPDDTVEVLLEAVEADSDNAKLIAEPHIWSKEFGMLSVEDHLKKVEIKKESEALKRRQQADRLRMQDEVRATKELRKDPKERDEPKEKAPSKTKKEERVKEEMRKMYGDDPDVLIDPVTGAKVAKVTKSSK